MMITECDGDHQRKSFGGRYAQTPDASSLIKLRFQLSRIVDDPVRRMTERKPASGESTYRTGWVAVHPWCPFGAFPCP
jgi:hypothetical protein